MSNKDCRGIERWQCQNCDMCERFLEEKGTFMCENEQKISRPLNKHELQWN